MVLWWNRLGQEERQTVPDGYGATGLRWLLDVVVSQDEKGRKRESKSIRQRGSRVEVGARWAEMMSSGKEWLRCGADS